MPLDTGRQYAPTKATIRNAMTIDVEDYFQVSAFEHCIPAASWPTLECRIEANMERILALLGEHQIRATFFTLSWIAERYPALVRRIVAAGHELASHGHNHLRASNQTRSEFFTDVSLSKTILEDVGGQAVLGYRAPSFSIGAGNLWAFDCLDEAGYRYSSSIYPIAHDHYGMPESNRFAHYPIGPGGVLEIPVSTVRILQTNFPAGGGGFFRLYPYALSRWCMQRINRHDRQPGVFYFHPWEIDPGQPRQPGLALKTRLRHYLNLGRTENRLRALAADFHWGRMDHIFLEAV
jgi:polysaccharide deacetylase family protein (PEP-CTERM system associated)